MNHLTTAQLITLKAAILAEVNPVFVAHRTAGSTGAMADWYNVPSLIDAWRTQAPAQDLDEASDYSAFDNIVAGKRDAWGLFLRYAPRNMTRLKNRKVVTDVWGNAVAASVSAGILQACTEKATRGENVFGSTPATTGTVTAVIRNLPGRIDNNDIVQALGA